MQRSKNSQASPEPKNSRRPDTAKNSPSGNPDKNSRMTRGRKNTDAPTDAGATARDTHDGRYIEDIAAQLAALKRRQRRVVLRGVAVVVLPPVVLCVPLIALKAFQLLLISWAWCFAPLLLLLVPIALVFRAYFAALKAFRRQPDSRTAPRAASSRFAPVILSRATLSQIARLLPALSFFAA